MKTSLLLTSLALFITGCSVAVNHQSALAADFALSVDPHTNAVTGTTNCPGVYKGTARYQKFPISVFGWKPDTNVTTHTVTDTNRTDTHIIALGKLSNSFCDQTTVSVTNNFNEPYAFQVYFPTNGSPVPTNTYWITLHGFVGP